MKRLIKVITLSLLIPEFVFAAATEMEAPKSTPHKSWTSYFNLHHAIRVGAGVAILGGLWMISKSGPLLIDSITKVGEIKNNYLETVKKSTLPESFHEHFIDEYTQQMHTAYTYMDAYRRNVFLTLGSIIIGGVNEYYHYNKEVKIIPYFDDEK